MLRLSRALVFPALFSALALTVLCGNGLTYADPSDHSLRFAVIGDAGTGKAPQYELARAMADARTRFPFTLVLMAGDNVYGGWSSAAAVNRFERPYSALLASGVEFFASLGNHDDMAERYYAPFHMNGASFYRFRRGSVEFFALDSNYMNTTQLAWLDDALGSSTAV